MIRSVVLGNLVFQERWSTDAESVSSVFGSVRWKFARRMVYQLSWYRWQNVGVNV
jgi:hypothetical protein